MPRKTAKLFVNGGSQAVRLPAEFRFSGSEVYIRRDAITGEVILSPRSDSGGWSAFFALRDQVDIPPDFMAERPWNDPPPTLQPQEQR